MFGPGEILWVLIALIPLIFIWHYVKRKTLPPGPIGFPFVGMIPYRFVDLVFSKWIEVKTDTESFKTNKKKYGPFWSIEFGSQRIVVLSSWDLINEAFVTEGKLFSGRPTSPLFRFVSRGRGIIFRDGEIWRGHRQLAMKALRELGMGKDVLAERIIEEGDFLVSHLEEKVTSSSQGMDLFFILTKVVSNVVSRLVFEARNEFEDQDFQAYISGLRSITQSKVLEEKISLSPSLFQTSFMKNLFPDVGEYLHDIELCSNFIKKKCLERSRIQDEIDQAECVFDYFHRFRFGNDSSSWSPEEQNEEIVQVMFDLFGAGVDSTSDTLAFSCLLLGKYQDAQDDIRNELKASIVDGGRIDFILKTRCPKMLSFISEVQRFCYLLPRPVHRVMSKTVFHGYEIRPDDVVIADLGNLFFDPDLFQNPNSFDPYRFMDETKTRFSPSKFLIPFGIGKRVCLGANIAAMELFIFLEKIICRFKISLTEETQNNFDQIMKGHEGFIHGPLRHTMNLELI